MGVEFHMVFCVGGIRVPVSYLVEHLEMLACKSIALGPRTIQIQFCLGELLQLIAYSWFS